MGNKPIEERRYVVQKLQSICEYTNNSPTLECVTIIEGECVEEGIPFTTGTTVVLEPGETVHGNIIHAVMARPK